MGSQRWAYPPGEAEAIASQIAHYVHYGIFLISVPNLIVICVMVAVFVLGVCLRLPGHGGGESGR